MRILTDRFLALKEDMFFHIEPYKINDLINQLCSTKLVLTLSAPPMSGAAKILKLASSIGLEVAQRNNIVEIADEISKDNKNIKIIKTNYKSYLPQKELVGVVDVLVLPPEKRWLRKIENEDVESARHAKKYYSLFKKNTDKYDIILDEGNSPRRTLFDLFVKLNSYRELNSSVVKNKGELDFDLRCFIVWGHGLKYEEEIMAIIGNEFNIIESKYKKIVNIKTFLHEIYKKEILKKGRHILNKNKHLSRCSRTVLLIVVRDKKKDFDCKGHGTKNIICNNNFDHVKQLIRDKYNPKDASGQRTEKHVIHGSDSPEEVGYLLESFNLSIHS